MVLSWSCRFFVSCSRFWPADSGIPDSAGVTTGNAKDTLVVPYNDIDSLERIFEKEGKDIAALIMEPVPCNYGLIKPKEGYLQRVRDLCTQYGVILIFDEVITGFRLARGGAQEYYGVKPDLTTLGKIIGGGLPVGAYGGRKDIMSKIAPEGPVIRQELLPEILLQWLQDLPLLKRSYPQVL
jgi:glutamate-1-semialdehyde 2,1-aminomutase